MVVSPLLRSMPPSLVRLTAAVLLTVGALSLAACDRAPETVTVDRADVRLGLAADGSLEILEHLEIGAADAPRTFVRDLRTTRVDAVRLEMSTVDGQPQAPSSLTEGRRLRASWPLPAGPARVVELRYRATGVLAIQPQRGVLQWPALPADGSLRVAQARVSVARAPGATETGPTGMLEPDWTVARTATGIVAERADVGTAGATVHVETSIDTSRVALPAWQVREDQQQQFAPAFLAGVFFVLVIGAGVLGLLRLQYPPVRPGPADRLTAGLEASPGLTRLLHQAPERWSPPDRAALVEVGWLDRERLVARDGLRVTAFVGVPLALLCAVAGAWWLGHFGAWAQTIPVSLLLVSGIFLLASRRMPVLTAAGEGVRRALTRQ